MQSYFEEDCRSVLTNLVCLLDRVEGDRTRAIDKEHQIFGKEEGNADAVHMGSGRLRRWAYLEDGLSGLPVLICVGGKRYANETIVEFAAAVLDASAAKRIESAVAAEEKHQLFTRGFDGNTVYLPGVAIIVRVDTSPSCRKWEVDVHESVHVSQFIVQEKFGKNSLESISAQEAQAEIVERYCRILQKIRHNA